MFDYTLGNRQETLRKIKAWIRGYHPDKKRAATWCTLFSQHLLGIKTFMVKLHSDETQFQFDKEGDITVVNPTF
jgi:hypothetical protein